MVLKPRPGTVIYPSSDGEPVAEKGPQYLVLTGTADALMRRYRHNPQVLVAANLFLYYQEGDPDEKVAPDVMVVFDVPNHPRDTFKTWEEGAVPRVVFEITSSSSRITDKGTKRAVYEEIGVREYFLFDPLGEYLKPRLQGFQLTEAGYVPMTGQPLVSHVLGLHLEVDDWMLRLRDSSTGERLPLSTELEDALKAETQARQQAEQAMRVAQEAREESEAALRQALDRERALRDEIRKLRREVDEKS